MDMQPCSIYIHATWHGQQHGRELGHAACICPCCISIAMLHFRAQAACPCLSPYYFHVHAASPYPCCRAMSMLHVHVHAACPCPCCMSMSVLYVHVHAACPCPCCMTMSMLHVYVHAACPCPCCMSMPMSTLHGRMEANILKEIF